jgi:hypothetical protein
VKRLSTVVALALALATLALASAPTCTYYYSPAWEQVHDLEPIWGEDACMVSFGSSCWDCVAQDTHTGGFVHCAEDEHATQSHCEFYQEEGDIPPAPHSPKRPAGMV